MFAANAGNRGHRWIKDSLDWSNTNGKIFPIEATDQGEHSVWRILAEA